MDDLGVPPFQETPIYGRLLDPFGNLRYEWLVDQIIELFFFHNKPLHY